MCKITPENQIYIENELEHLVGKHRTHRVKELAKYFGVSNSTISRYSGRVYTRRTDAGNTSISEDDLMLIGSRLLISKQLQSKFSNSVANILEQLELEGYTFPVGYERICTLLRERGYDKDSLSTTRPHVRLISKHPNHVWQFDVTNCLQWHLDNKTGLTARDIELSFYNNKLVQSAKKIKQELLRFAIIDHCTGSFFFWYYYASGERAEDGADFFYRAFANKTTLLDDELELKPRLYQMHGVPNILASDKGSILRHKGMCSLMESLGVDIELHAAGNPRAKGAVERLMRTIGTKFESVLKLQRVASVEELNKMAFAWCVNHNEQYVSSRKQLSPAQYWLRITKDQLRLCPPEDIYKMLIHKPEATRKVDGSGHISFENRQYFVPDVNATNQTVIVRINAYEYPAIDVHYDNHIWLCKPLGEDLYGRVMSPANVTYGQYKALPATKQEKIITELEQVAHETTGIIFKGNSQKRQSIAPSAENAKITTIQQVLQDDKVITMQKTGSKIEANPIKPLTKAQSRLHTITPAESVAYDERFISVSELIVLYVREVGKLTLEQNKALRELYSKTGVPLTEVEKIINNINEHLEQLRIAN